MIKKTILSSAQLLLILIGSRLMFSYTFLPVISIPPSNQDAWIVVILSIFYIAIISLPLLYMASKFRGKPAVEALEIILGKPLGKAVAFIYAIFAFFCFITCVLVDIIFLTSAIFPETPSWALLLYILIPVGYAAFKGIGTIGRLSVFIVPYIIITIVFFLLIGYKIIDLNSLKPILADSGFWDLNKGAIINASEKSEAFIFFALAVFLDKEVKIKRVFFLELLISATLVLMMVVPTLSVLGSELAEHTIFPYFVYTKQMLVYDFIARVESLNVLAWFLGSLLRASLFCFMASYFLSDIFKVKKKGLFVFPLVFITFILILVPAIGNTSMMLKLTSYKLLPWIMFPATFILPVIILLVYAARKKKIGDKFVDKQKAETQTPEKSKPGINSSPAESSS